MLLKGTFNVAKSDVFGGFSVGCGEVGLCLNDDGARALAKEMKSMASNIQLFNRN